jgi:outer membrane protein assembly factor BamB
VNATPVFGAGRIYFCTSDGTVVALDKAGNKVWSGPLKAPAAEGETASAESPGAPPIFVAGMVVVGASSGNLYGLDAATGAVKWMYETGDTIMGTPNWISVGGGKEHRVVVIAQSDGTLHCVDAATGKGVWKSEPTNRCDGSPAVQGSRIAYGNCDAAIHIFSADDGKSLKTIEVGTDKQVAGGVALAGDFVFSGNRSGSLVCGDIEKAEIAWSNEEGSEELFTTPAVSADRVVYAGGDANLYGVDRKSGKTLWSFKSGGISGQSPVIAGSKVVASVDGTLYVFRADNGEKLWSDNVADSLTSPAVGDGMVVVGTGEGFVMAFGAEGGK